jgi:hypothetical protein
MAFGYRTKTDSVGYAVRRLRFMVVSHIPVAAPKLASRPDPARARFIDLGPKSFDFVRPMTQQAVIRPAAKIISAAIAELNVSRDLAHFERVKESPRVQFPPLELQDWSAALDSPCPKPALTRLIQFRIDSFPEIFTGNRTAITPIVSPASALPELFQNLPHFSKQRNAGSGPLRLNGSTAHYAAYTPSMI